MTESKNTEVFGVEVCYERSCLRSLQRVPERVTTAFIGMTSKIMIDSKTNGLHVEPIEGARDRTMKSVRLTKGYRAVGSLQGRTMLFLHVDEHDKAYSWARGRTVSYDRQTSRIRIVEAETHEQDREAGAAKASFRQPGLFDKFDDRTLVEVGIDADEVWRVREIVSEADLHAREERFDATSYDILCALYVGYDPSEVRDVILGARHGASVDRPTEEGSLGEIMKRDQGLATIFVPKNEEEMARILESDLPGWRVFLHPDQRRFAYRDYNGPALVRGGAGTGKTVVAMHRARHLADRIAEDSSRAGERVLVTTYTKNLARDIEGNLMTLCPEHLEERGARIEVCNLDAWVVDYLKRRGFKREIVYGPHDRTVKDIWDEVLEDMAVPDGLSPAFVLDEWAQVIQAKGIETRQDYFKTSRTGRGTPLDRRKRAELWQVFETVRARMNQNDLVERDDAFREAIALLRRKDDALPYAAVVMDEAQDMGEQAFRLVAEIAKGSSDPGNAIFMVGDAHQRIYRHRASMSACGIDIRGRSRKLRLNYRTSDAIRRWAVSVMEGVEVDDLDEGLDSLKGYRSLFSGPDPELEGVASQEAELDLIALHVETMPEDVSQSSICVLARTNRLVGAIEEHLKERGLQVVRIAEGKVDPRDKGVRVATMHRAKGLEFDTIFMAGMNAETIPPPAALNSAVDPAGRRQAIEQERSLVHVAATRAKRRLHVSWNGEPSELLPSLKVHR